MHICLISGYDETKDTSVWMIINNTCTLYGKNTKL